MNTYKKISLLLIFSTTLTANNHDLYNTSGEPDITDFDDQATGPRFSPFKQTPKESTLEKEVKKQTQVPQVIKPTPTTTAKRQTALEIKANAVANEFLDLCAHIERHNTRIAYEKTYQTSLEELENEKQFGLYEETCITITAVTAVSSVYFFMNDCIFDAKTLAGAAIIAGAATASSYISRYRLANHQEEALTADHQKSISELEKFISTKTREELIQEAEVKLAILKKLPLPRGLSTIQELENSLNRLKA